MEQERLWRASSMGNTAMKPAQHQGNQNRHIHLACQRDREGGRLRRQIELTRAPEPTVVSNSRDAIGERGIGGEGSPPKATGWSRYKVLSSTPPNKPIST